MMKSEIEVTQKGLNQGFKLAKKAILKWLGVAKMANNEVWKCPKWEYWPKTKFHKGWNNQMYSLKVARNGQNDSKLSNVSHVLWSFKSQISDYRMACKCKQKLSNYYPFSHKDHSSMTYDHVVMFWVSMFYVQHTFHETSKSRRPYFRMHKVWL